MDWQTTQESTGSSALFVGFVLRLVCKLPLLQHKQLKEVVHESDIILIYQIVQEFCSLGVTCSLWEYLNCQYLPLKPGGTPKQGSNC